MADDREARERRHRQIYGSRGLPALDTEWVTDRVLAGRNCLSEIDVAHLVDDEGITHVLDLREEHEWCSPWFGQDAVDAFDGRAVVRLHLPIEDGGAPTLEDLDAAAAFIDEALSDPSSKVYVHCRAGEERTATILVAWYARRFGVSYDEALAALRRGRARLRPYYTQEAVVREWLARRAASGSSIGRLGSG